MTQKGQILTVITGSRLHGLNKPDSDTDYRGVFMNPLPEIVDPFARPEDTRWIEGATQDDTSYELRKFVKEVTHGNPNFVEILFSNRVVFANDIGRELRDNAQKFLDSKRIFEAFKGYASNQLNKMELFTPDARTPKFAVAYIRSLAQGVDLLRTGSIENPLRKWFYDSTSFPWEFRDFLRKVKETPPERFDEVRTECIQMFSMLQNELALAFYDRETPKFEPDKEWIRDFVFRAYGVRW